MSTITTKNETAAKTVGIIAEYNPFHCGHLYQIRQIREQANADTIVIIMSGNFVQRGLPAWCDKYLRTRMALCCGADLVFELPTIYATANAEVFATGGIALLSSLGFVDTVCFGSECGSLPTLQKIADAALCISDRSTKNRYGTQLRSLLKQGLSYPAAYTKVICSILSERGETDLLSAAAGEYENLLASPNNILSIEYLKALRRLHSPLEPFTVKREGSSYHDETISEPLPSASGIRKAYQPAPAGPGLSAVSGALPEACTKLLRENTERILTDNTALSEMLYYKLRTETDELTKYLDVTRELSCRIRRQLPEFQNFEQFALALKTRQYTYTRICRCLLHILLDIRTQDADNYLLLPPSGKGAAEQPSFAGESIQPLIPYARLLGFRREKSHLLRNVTDTTLITKTASAKKQLTSNAAGWLWEKDLLASELYRHCFPAARRAQIPDEYHAGIVIL